MPKTPSSVAVFFYRLVLSYCKFCQHPIKIAVLTVTFHSQNLIQIHAQHAENRLGVDEDAVVINIQDVYKRQVSAIAVCGYFRERSGQKLLFFGCALFLTWSAGSYFSSYVNEDVYKRQPQLRW